MRRLGAPFLLVVLLTTVGWGQGSDGDALLARARGCWESEAFAEGAAAYRELRDRFPDHDDVKAGEAQFWIWCCLGRAGRKAEANQEIEVFLRDYPNHSSCGYALFFLGVHRSELGDGEKAREAWRALLEKYPGSPMVEHARRALAAPPIAGAESSAVRPSDFLAGAEAAGRWLRRIARSEGAGLDWTEYEGTGARKVGFYEGGAGICLYFVNLWRVTGRDDYRDAARLAARALLDRAQRSGEGLSWREEDERDDGTVVQQEPSASLYVGAAGIGWVLLALDETWKDPEMGRAARASADGILAATAAGWGEATDVISGPAGTGFFLLDAHRVTGERKYLDAAVRAADWLIAQGTADGEGMKWKSAASLERWYTGFSHGTAGIAAYLLRVHEATQEAKYLAAAERGARWLLQRAVADSGGLKWWHWEPGAKDRFQTGWCHGPPGTGRLFLELHRVTGKLEYRNAVVKAAEWLTTQIDPVDPAAPYHGRSMCCGAAGVGDWFLDLFLALDEDRWLEQAAGVGRTLLARGAVDGDGMKWTNCDTPDEEGKVYYGTGHMIGAAGVGSFLLRLHAVLAGREGAFLPFADKARRAAAASHERAEYVIATPLAETDPFFAAARRLARHRQARILRFRLDQPAALQRRLAELQPRWVAFVLDPRDLDVNLHRRILTMACRMDDDPFADFAFGYVTGPTPEAALRLVEGSIAVETEGIRRTWVSASVIGGTASYVTDTPAMPAAEGMGFTGRSVHWACVEDDAEVRRFVGQHAADLAGKGVVSLSGNGDPEGIWLFHDDRNRDRTKHWPFAPDKVAWDPKGEMPRITAAAFRGLDLARAVVWSGTCHSGVLYRAFVEGDIVSTFGTVDRATEYLVPAERSLGLAILGAGPSAFLAPIGPNHGYSCLVEQVRALTTGMALGEVMRGRYGEIALVEGAPLSPALTVADGPESNEDPMRGGGVNRVLYGDPAYRPFPGGGKGAWEKTMTVATGGLRVRGTVRDERSFEFWDMFGGDCGHPQRVYLVVELPEAVAEVTGVTAAARGVDGAPIALAPACRWAVEKIDGKRLLHLQANAEQDALARNGTVVDFDVRTVGHEGR